MKYTHALLVAGLLSIGNLLAEPDLSKLPPASTKEGVTYQTDIRPLFEASCVRCHSGPKPHGGLRLNSLEGALKGGKDGKVIKPGDSAKSDIVIAASRIDPETAMPPSPKRRGRRPNAGGGPGGPEGPGGPGGPGGPDGPGGPPPQFDHNGDGMTNRPPGGGPPRGPQGPPPKPLIAEQVGLLRAWIDQGAR